MVYQANTVERSKPRPRWALVYDALKREIMLGELAVGMPLVELELAWRFSCSQSTVREALLQLQEEGLVNRRVHKGTTVSDCTAAEAKQMTYIRQQLECEGITLAIERPSKTLIADLEAIFARMTEAADRDDELDLVAHDREFHRRIFRDANLPALDMILHRCLVHNHRFKIAHSEGPRDLQLHAARHRPIIEAIERSDPLAAVDLIRHHIATIRDRDPHIFPETV